MHGQSIASINIRYVFMSLPGGIYLNDLLFLCTDCNNFSWYDILWEYPEHTSLRQQVGTHYDLL